MGFFSIVLIILFSGVKVVNSQMMNCVNPPPTVLTAPSGNITQPPFPSPVWNGTICGDFFWTIQAPGECDTITWTMDSYSLVAGLDRVEVYDGTYPGGTNLGRWQGQLQASDPAKPVVTSTGNIMTVWFNTTAYPGGSINFASHYQINSIPCTSNSTTCQLTNRTKCKLRLGKYKSVIGTWPYFKLVWFCIDFTKKNKRKFICDQKLPISKLPLIIVLIKKFMAWTADSGRVKIL
ncbi:uncharacterized protein LOC110856471 [Folsomia candida]|uniref:CUB domain-containing protein 2 n=1 Tax=Folsomia candida TaxID=158441 RepID=A0A226DLB1_FOLCA|nr:uncharacterized protein LOC110856471 [Folsomia candida]OXA46325.1 CUB domain-containing protein 2 [Folsomia candida]